VGPQTVAWGHQTDVTQNIARTFAGNWTGGTVNDSGDNETLTIEFGENSESETWNLGAGNATILIDSYQSGSGPAPTIEYKTGDSKANCDADTWHAYSGGFTSKGWIKVRLSR
jgi:hypothetical protein